MDPRHSVRTDRSRNRSRLSLQKICSLFALLAAWPFPTDAAAQSGHILEIGAQAIGVGTRVSPAIHGRDLTEGYLTQPAIMAMLAPWGELLALKATADFEGATVKRGELTPGIYGEGYIDRRHPHTYLHELLVTSSYRFSAGGSSGASITVGKGFAPFGTDDPMSRPFEKYPINHHLAQILERAVAIGAVRAGPWIFEAGTFNGDEPTAPGDAPNRNRYWDSWSGRITFVPWQQGEFQTSYARLKSPEDPTGVGPDQRKQSASIRLEDAQHSGYALFEWAHTGEYIGSLRTLSLTSLLAETSARYDRISGALRIERTERPDEDRLADEFRTSVPPTGVGIEGRSRWTIVTARVSVDMLNAKSFAIQPFTEVARAKVSPTLSPAGFDPRQFYGSDRIWTFSIGARLSFGMSHMRMGRYGVAVGELPKARSNGMSQHDMHDM